MSNGWKHSDFPSIQLGLDPFLRGESSQRASSGQLKLGGDEEAITSYLSRCVSSFLHSERPAIKLKLSRRRRRTHIDFSHQVQFLSLYLSLSLSLSLAYSASRSSVQRAIGTDPGGLACNLQISSPARSLALRKHINLDGFSPPVHQPAELPSPGCLQTH